MKKIVIGAGIVVVALAVGAYYRGMFGGGDATTQEAGQGGRGQGGGAGRQGGGRGRQAGPPPGPAPRNAQGRVVLGGECRTVIVGQFQL